MIYYIYNSSFFYSSFTLSVYMLLNRTLSSLSISLKVKSLNNFHSFKSSGGVLTFFLGFFLRTNWCWRRRGWHKPCLVSHWCESHLRLVEASSSSLANLLKVLIHKDLRLRLHWITTLNHIPRLLVCALLTWCYELAILKSSRELFADIL